MNKQTTVVTRTSEEYEGMTIYAVEPVHTRVGVVCCVASLYELDDGEVIELDGMFIPVKVDTDYTWIEQKE